MKHCNLRTLIFLALCCDLGLFSKRIVAPFANVITDALHIPGGVGTSFSLMFLVIAAVLLPDLFCGTVMSAVQSALALAFGMVGSMGPLAPIGYIVPGFVIDLVLLITASLPLSRTERMVLANGLAASSAAFTANCIVFHLSGIPLALYLSVAASSGLLCGLLGDRVARRLLPVVKVQAGKSEYKGARAVHE